MREFFLKLASARGEVPADLLIKNARLVNVLSGEIYRESIAVMDGRIVGFGNYDAKEVIDADNMYIAPGFIDAHIHFESSMLTLPEFSRAVMPHGTTAVVIDPHEIANVLGLDGIRYVLNNLNLIPLDVFVMIPSCVPATPLETSGAVITEKELKFMIYEEKVAGVGEMMNFPAVINGEEHTHWKINAAKWKKVDGHAPGVRGKDLNAYILSKIDSDHESTTAEEALEKLRKGMHIHIREGTSERNLHEIVPIVTKNNSFRFSFATDDKHPDHLMKEGHIDYSIREAIKMGMEPVTAYQIATINTAMHYNLKNIGAIKPRYWADFVLLSDLEDVKIEAVYKKGKLVFRKDSIQWSFSGTLPSVRSTMNPGDITQSDIAVKAEGNKIRVIDIIPGQVVTDEFTTDANIVNGKADSDIKNDILKIVVIERHNASGNIGKAFVHGFGLKKGAIGSTIAHDSHNIVIVGTNDRDIFTASEHLKKIQGGLTAVENGRVIGDLPLPVAGLLSEQPFEQVVENLTSLREQVHKLGCRNESPFMILSFLCLSAIPKLKITDIGLIDVSRFRVVPLFTQ